MTFHSDPDRVVLNILPHRGSATVYEVHCIDDGAADKRRYTVAKQTVEGLQYFSKTLILVNREKAFSEIDVDRSSLEGTYDSLKQLCVPLHPQFAIGVDGAYYLLRIDYMSQHVELHFWNCWKDSNLYPVQTFQHAFSSVVDKLLTVPKRKERK